MLDTPHLGNSTDFLPTCLPILPTIPLAPLANEKLAFIFGVNPNNPHCKVFKVAVVNPSLATC